MTPTTDPNRVEVDTDNVEVTPGTVHLVDAQGSMQSMHGKGAEQDIVLVPRPSSHPDDPLNWAKRRKLLSAYCMAIYVLVIGICSSSLYSTLGPLTEATGLSYFVLNSGTGYMFLLFGWGCVFWQAVAIQYGKRPVYLITVAGTLGVMVWQPHVRSSGEWYAAKILQGIFGAPIESLAEVTVSDVFFTHERGRYMALYTLALGYSNGIAPLIMGFINDRQGYQWVFYWCAIFCGIALVVIFFFMEETKFDRASYMTSETAPTAGPLAPEPTSKDSPDLERTISIEKVEDRDGNEGQQEHRLAINNTNTSAAEADSTLYQKKSYAARLKPIEPQNLRNDNKLLQLLARPFYMYKFLIVPIAGFMYGSNITWLSVLHATQSMVLSGEPYNMSSSAVGITFIAPLVGTTLASIYTGLFGDRFILKMARQNKGFFEAEHRIWLMIPSLVLIPLGCILFGVGAFHHVHWFGVVFAMGVISFTTTAGSQISIAYTVDCYRDLAGDALAAVMIIRNTMAFAIGYGVTPWVTNMGYQNAFIVGAFAGLGHNLIIFPLIKWGVRLRQRNAEQ